MHRTRQSLAAATLLLAALAVGRAAADPSDPCLHGTQVEEVIDACTRGISDQLRIGHTRGHDLALAFLARGKAMLKRDFDRAMRDFDEAIKADPGFAEAYATRGMQFLVRKQDVARAVADYSQAIRLAPTNAHFRLNRALIYSRNSDYAAALADYDQAIKLEPTTQGYVGRGIVFDKKGDYDRALADFSEAIRLDRSGRSSGLFRPGGHPYEEERPR